MGPMRVLLVDDSEDVRLLFRIVLQSDPRFVLCGEAANGEEAIVTAASSHPDAIILDIMMPVMDGVTAFPFLKALCPATPIIFITATPDVRNSAAGLGAYAVLNKSTALEQLKPMLLEAHASAGATTIVRGPLRS